MFQQRHVRRSLVLLGLMACVLGVTAPRALAQGFISPSFGYNFSGDAGCRTALDCKDKNWNWGFSMGALGPVVGIEAELGYDGEFTGQTADESVSVLILDGKLHGGAEDFDRPAVWAHRHGADQDRRR